MAKTAKAKTVEVTSTVPATALTLAGNTFQDRLEIKIEAAQAAKELEQDKALDNLLENDAFVEAQRGIIAKEGELQKLNDVITQLNFITPFKANDGRKFNVNVYPIAQFGVGLGQVMGIIAGSRSAFVDETRVQFTAITGLTSIELYEAVDALGSPSYFKDGKVNDAVDGDFGKLESLLPGIFMRLGLNEYVATDISRDKFNLYFAAAEAKALRLLKEHDELTKLEEKSTDFVLED